MDQLELWGGIECTVNRVGDVYRDQIRSSGHHHRLSDLDDIAGLGITRIRYPILWERVAPDLPERQDWRWTDERLGRLRALGVHPIAGLVHHGSGPRYTDLLSEEFAPLLAAFAQAAAERYPWIEDWTPVNEPLTTARFSCLYGHWYPHAREEGAFWTALINQVEGVIAAMRAIRRAIPTARLIQTDDLGRTYATAILRDQAAFDNVRRWMSWDLLFGRVTKEHPLWTRLCAYGLGDRLRRIADNPCLPDCIGINHYLTSDRFLDHRIRAYPKRTRGGNRHQRYADVEAVRALAPAGGGVAGAISEAWARYATPIAITEVHNGCTRDEQMRWMAEAWDIALAARERGVDVRAVTSWALLGSQDWDLLLTGPGRYEAGTFDVSTGQLRPTAMAGLLRALRDPSTFHHVLADPGWWRRAIRLEHPVVARPAPMRDHEERTTAPSPHGCRPLLIAGATGTLGQALAAACQARALSYVLTGRAELDLADEASINGALDRHHPWAVINAAGWVRVDEAESAPEACHAANAQGALRLAAACAERQLPSVTMSSDLVFDGTKPAYVESDHARPLNVYGMSKAAAETDILALDGAHLVVRTAAFFSEHDRHNFAVHTIAALRRGETFAAAEDQIVSPTYVPDLCSALLDLVIDGATGIWHLSNGEGVSWADFARRLAIACGLAPERVQGAPGATLDWKARRPAATILRSERGALMPPLQSAIERFAMAI
ncbi:MAG: NAD(P)-dependent oxidoreductase [Sphingomonas sp.]|nr:NAD(P)-dependent oxidoreductase [Sphingomonas sp.]